MSLPKINFESKETILRSFNEIADKIGKEIQLQINDVYYRLVDFEFYAYAEKFPDPHTYKHDLQLQFGKFYLHASGVDMALILLWHNNELANPFPVSRKGIMELAHVHCIVTYHKCIGRLEANGYICDNPSYSYYKRSTIYLGNVIK